MSAIHIRPFAGNTKRRVYKRITIQPLRAIEDTAAEKRKMLELKAGYLEAFIAKE